MLLGLACLNQDYTKIEAFSQTQSKLENYVFIMYHLIFQGQKAILILRQLSSSNL